MDNKASVTALMSAFVRAYHAQNSEKPVFTDRVARKLMSDAEFESMKSYIKSGVDFFAPEKKGAFADDEDLLEWLVNTQLAPTVLARACFCEERLRTAVMTGTQQYVMLGAGLDTFAWRETELMKKLEVFEADHPLTQADKKRRLEQAGLEVPENLHFVPVDFSSDSLAVRLEAQGFDPCKKTFFGWFGVSYYLTAEQIGHMLAQISSFAAEGSSLAFDFAAEELFSSEVRRVRNMLAMAAAGGEPMKFCTGVPQLTALLEEHNFLVYELLNTGDVDEAYFGDRPDALDAFEGISFALAVIKGTPFINTKEKILLTALRLFAHRGYEAVSVRDIAGQLGITQAALYKHYKSKRDIFDSIVKRMEYDDARRAGEFGVPSDTPENVPGEYESADVQKIKDFTIAQFYYWTQNTFASNFRRLLTLEQYANPEISDLYRNYLSGGVIAYMEDIFRALPPIRGREAKSPKQLALEFYAPLYMLIGLCDTAENRKEIISLAKKHVDSFFGN